MKEIILLLQGDVMPAVEKKEGTGTSAAVVVTAVPGLQDSCHGDTSDGADVSIEKLDL